MKVSLQWLMGIAIMIVMALSGFLWNKIISMDTIIKEQSERINTMRVDMADKVCSAKVDGLTEKLYSISGDIKEIKATLKSLIK